MGFNLAFKVLKLLKTPVTGVLNNLNDPNRPQCVKKRDEAATVSSRALLPLAELFGWDACDKHIVQSKLMKNFDPIYVFYVSAVILYFRQLFVWWTCGCHIHLLWFLLLVSHCFLLPRVKTAMVVMPSLKTTPSLSFLFQGAGASPTLSCIEKEKLVTATPGVALWTVDCLFYSFFTVCLSLFYPFCTPFTISFNHPHS